MKKTLALIAGILALGGSVLAQNNEKSQQIITERIVTGERAASQPILLLNEMDGMGKVVKNAPYTAHAVTETTQTLGDGNRIVNKTTASLARDSEGRTRREESFPKVGNLSGENTKAIMINDPVAHSEYLSQPGGKLGGEGLTLNTLEQKPKKFFHISLDGPENKDEQRALGDTVFVRKPGMIEFRDEPGSANVKHESLGTQVIEGINTEGTRDTRTIPAGAVGNEKPIVITSEVWTSPELQVVVLSKRNDPRFGETVYKLTDISRSEPDPALFQIPDKVKKDLK